MMARLKRGRGQRVRTGTERQRDMLRITELYDQGKTVKQIAAILQLAPNTVWHDLQLLDEEWSKETMSNIHRLKMRQIRQIQKAKVEAWEAWEKSKGGTRRTTVETKTGKDGQDAPTKKHIDHTESAGDPRYLAIYKDLCAREAQLIGMDSPRQASLTVEDEDGAPVPIASVVMLPARDTPPPPPPTTKSATSK